MRARRHWTKDEIRTLRRMYATTGTAEIAALVGFTKTSVYQKANKLGLFKSAAFLASQKSGRIQRGRSDPRMTATQFKPGQEAWNRGLHYMPGGNIRQGWFKKGCRSIRWPEDIYGIGALRVTTDGTLLIRSKPDRGRHGWEIMARFVWRTERGPIPKGHVIRAINGDGHDTRIENLECITLAENARRNSHWNKYPKEVSRLIQLKGAITRQANRIAREARA